MNDKFRTEPDQYLIHYASSDHPFQIKPLYLILDVDIVRSIFSKYLIFGSLTL